MVHTSELTKDEKGNEEKNRSFMLRNYSTNLGAV